MSLGWLPTLLLYLSSLTMAAETDNTPYCLACHTATSNVAVHAVFQTVHGGLGGGGAGSCIGCHGDSIKHARNPSAVMSEVSFGPPTEERSGSCLSCHRGSAALHWAGSEHQREAMARDSCQDSHKQQDPALTPGESQQACLSCHTRVRAELLLPSRHPIAEGETACGDCHNPHGSPGDANLPYASGSFAGGSGNQNLLGKNCLDRHSQVHGSNHPSGARLTQ